MLPRPARGTAMRRALILGACLVPVPALAGSPQVSDPDGLQLSGSMRVRAEVLDGQFRPKKAESDRLLLIRTNVVATYTKGPVQFVGELMDARVYGSKINSPIGVSDVNTFEPLQAYLTADLGDIAGDKLAGEITAGRFTMEISASRLIGRPDFANFPSSFTGATAVLKSDDADLLLFWTMPSIRLPRDTAALRRNEWELDRATTDVQFFGAHYTRPVSDGVTGEVFAYRLREKDAPGYQTRNRDLFTYGGRLSRAAGPGIIDFDVDFALQSGRARGTSSAADLRDLDVAASFIHAEVGRRAKGGWKPRISLHFDYATGDGPEAKYTRFDPLFGARGEFGPTDVFGPLTRSNLVAGGVRLEARPGARTDLMAMYRALWLEEPTDSFASTERRNPTGANSWAGNEIELRLRYWLLPDRLRLEGAAAYLDKGEVLRDAPSVRSAKDTRLLYLALNTLF